MKTIRDVFISNLIRLRGERTQEQVAEGAGIPVRSYQRAEYGEIPQTPNLKAIAKSLGVPETHLFVDMEEFQPGRPDPRLELLRLIPDLEKDAAATLLNIAKGLVVESSQDNKLRSTR